MSPQRIQRKRTKGWRMPEGAVYVGRPTPYGNPFPIDGDGMWWAAVALGYKADKPGRRATAVALFRSWLTGEPLRLAPSDPSGGSLEFSGGRVVSMNDHVRNLAAGAAFTVYGVGEVLVERPRLGDLRGQDLACWCPLDQPCHADVLLEIANSSGPPGDPQ